MKLLFLAFGWLILNFTTSLPVFAADKYSEIRSTTAGGSVCPSSVCNQLGGIQTGNIYNPLCCIPPTIRMMRSLNKVSFELVRREIQNTDFIYFIDTSTSTRIIREELENRVGRVFEPLGHLHKHTVSNIVKQYKRSRGWPSAGIYKIKSKIFRNVCIIAPLSHERTGMEFVMNMMGGGTLPVTDEIDEFVIRFLSITHESYHCISASKSHQIGSNGTFFETIADVGAVNEALKLGINIKHLVALSDWRALRFASAIADVVSGRKNGKAVYSDAAPSHLSSVAINRLLQIGPLNSYEQIEDLVKSTIPEGLYRDKKKAQQFLTRIFLLYKNTEIKDRFPQASIQDVGQILGALEAPLEMIEIVEATVQRYLTKLNCKNIVLVLNKEQINKLSCEQSDGSHKLFAKSIFGSPY